MTFSRLARNPRVSAPGDLQRRVAKALPLATEAEKHLLRSAARWSWWSQCSPDERAAILTAEQRAT